MIPTQQQFQHRSMCKDTVKRTWPKTLSSVLRLLFVGSFLSSWAFVANAEVSASAQPAPNTGATIPDSAYQYPIPNPYLATVAGTPEALQGPRPEVRFKKRHLPQVEGREIPKVLWYGRRLQYSYAAQRHPAPLVYVIAGTGAYHTGGTNLDLMRAFYGAGYHVVGITSPTHPEFIIAASQTSLPGNLRLDAQDLHKVMSEIADHLPKRVKVTNYHMAGYSLGAMHAAFVAKQDAQDKRFNFERVVMINSPVTLYASISKLDRMLENIPGGVDNFNQYFSSIVGQIGNAYGRSTNVEFNQDLVFEAFKERPPTREELAALIGSAFRIASANMIFTSDVMTNFGFIKPKEVVLKNRSSMADYLQVGLRVGLTDYFHEFFWPSFADRYPAMNRQAFAKRQSLHSIKDFLAATPSIEAIHNADDIILEHGQIHFFGKVFGERATIYPHGGHLGNITQVQTLAKIVGPTVNKPGVATREAEQPPTLASTGVKP